MIIARSPMRISLGGGGTDLPSYYSQFGGFFMSAAIDRYVYAMTHTAWNSDEYIIKYSQLERTKSIHDIKHPIIRAALSMLEIEPNIEICSIADIPAGTGLGSSGSFTTALLKALHAYKKHTLISPEELAEQAFQIEMKDVCSPVGKQDQYISAYGGITCFEIGSDGHVIVCPANISQQTLYTLEDNLAIFFTGYSRSANELLKEQDEKSKKSDSKMIEDLHFVKALGFKIRDALESGNLHQFGLLMHEHWERKRSRSKGMSNPKINELYNLAIENGAIGGKLIGAGGGGFLMFYTENKRQLREAMIKVGIDELRFKFDFEGSKLLV
ncbi:MAG: galactokinase [Gammaproteobacteria bacterium RIFCSPHIGHO2_12_FULL_40_19]|nr:MAG: galactokinase [Gammaproteobacteria bacterium RIFCSPHIGHO2_12_FULL_40_19]